MNSITLYFHFDELVFEYPLSSDNDRRISVDVGERLGLEPRILHLEVWDHVWHILSGDDVLLSVGGVAVEDRVLAVSDTINGLIQAENLAFTIVVRVLNEEQTQFGKYALAGRDTITIGSDTGADIVIKDSFASKRHAVLTRQGNGYMLSDYSRNGTFINNRRVREDIPLQMMDTIYIVGVKLIFLGELIAVNQLPLLDILLPEYAPPEQLTEPAVTDAALIRAPRLVEPLDTEAVEIEPPPAAQKQRRNPLIFTIGPAITMPLPILMSVLINSTQGSSGGFYLGTIISVALSAMMGLIWTLANNIYSKRASKKEEELRVSAYQNYISNNDKLLQEKHRHNNSVLSSQHLSPQELMSVLDHNVTLLWNRNVNQHDFLSVRLGVGPVAFQGGVQAPKQRFSLTDDPLVSEPQKLLEKYGTIPQTVSLVDLRASKVFGVLGPEQSLRETARVIALQTAALHAYTDVKMAFLLRPEDESVYEWAKWLPHVRTQDQRIRMMAVQETERQTVLFTLNDMLRARAEQLRENKAPPQHLPHIIVFCTSPELINHESIYQYMAEPQDFGVTFVLLYGALDQLPNVCTHIIQRDGDFVGYYQLDQARSETNRIDFDRMSSADAEALARRIGNFHVLEQSTGEIPATISFLEMYGLSRVEQWDLIKRWKENRAYESMRALVGIGTGGKPLYLDIHEKQHGPHGLMAGTTGSGKSETIQTYILSLAMSFHPQEIAFILIDYKGGGMANAFLDLPHLAGTITNLDGNQTTRALVSIQGEIKRRQALFNEYKVNHIDQYTRLFREGRALEPMPHLIIISDEFAELKKERPEFIKELVSAARVGRSLGVHLILATQKPSGVVDDEIWSNSRFKVCLRVQDKQDSNEMLKRPEAAYLTQTGRAYMQIGNDEIFEMFQSGYSGAYYEPSDELLSEQDSEVMMVGLDGMPLMIKAKQKSGGVDQISQLEACVTYIRSQANEHRIQDVRQLWLPEMKPGGVLDDVPATKKEGGLVATFGMIDDPSRQGQEAAVLDFAALDHLLIAGLAGSGKSTLVQTLLFSLVTSYTPRDVVFYCLDFSGMLLRVFDGLPHCGGVIGREDHERVARTFLHMCHLIEERQKLFAQAQVGSFAEYGRVADASLPAVLLVIDNYFSFAEHYEELEEELASLSRDGVRYGIHLIVTLNHMGDMRYKLRQNFNTVLPLRLAERGDYMEALGVMPEFLPTNEKGRGLIGSAALEYQTVLSVAGDNEQKRFSAMKKRFEALPVFNGDAAPLIRQIPKEQTYEEYLNSPPVQEQLQAVPALCLGYKTENIELVALPLKDIYCYAVSTATAEAHGNMMANLFMAGQALDANMHIVNVASPSSPQRSDATYYKDDEDIFQLLLLLKEEFTKRSALRKQLQQADGEDIEVAIQQDFGRIFVFIDSLTAFNEIIYAPHEEDYAGAMEEYWKKGRGLGIHFFAGVDPSSGFCEAGKLFLNHRAGIHLGGRLDKQVLFEVTHIPYQEQTKPREISEGYALENGKPVYLFVPSHERKS